tara:strand:- start:761 stop:2479 length:1719 start_codon:yes stop_codon:yes gene_type:complete
MTPLTVKERIDAALVGGVEYKGTFNANTGLTNSGGNLNNAEKGDLYIIDTLGTIYGQTWAVGDHLLINDNMGGSIDNSKIDKVDNTDAVTSVNGLSGPVVLNGGNVGADYSASNYTEANTNIDGHLEGIDDQFALTAPLASPALTGNPTAPTQSASDNSTKIATTFYVDRAVSAGGASDASETVKGIIEIATNTEAQAASANNKALVPSNIGHIDTGDLNDDGTYQPADPGLASIAALTTSANKMIYTDGSDSYATTDLTAFARSLLDDANATTARATLSLGSAALLDADNTANNVVKLDSNGKLPAIDGSQLTNLASASDASETVKGIIEIATNAEAQAASANDKALVPSNIGNIDTGDLNDDGTYLKDLSADSSPQLGGDLDLNSNDIVTTGNADLGLAPAGTGFVEIKGNTNPGAIRLNCESNSHGVQLQSPAHSANATYQLILPTGVGTAGQVLKTDGGDGTSEPTAQLSWVDQSGGGGGGVTYSAITADPANAQAGYHYSCTGTFTITLATSGYSAGDEIRVKNMGTGTITIDPQTTTIDGSTTDYTLDVQYSAITLVSTGTNWEVI